jgi:hypothetical protein
MWREETHLGNLETDRDYIRMNLKEIACKHSMHCLGIISLCLCFMRFLWLMGENWTMNTPWNKNIKEQYQDDISKIILQGWLII